MNKGEKNMSLKDKKVLMNGIDYIDLDSVGSTVTTDNLVFPTDCSEAPETASEAEEMLGCHIYDCDDEWFTSLSSDDLILLFDFLELVSKNLVKVVFNDWKTKIWGLWEEDNNCFMNLETI